MQISSCAHTARAPAADRLSTSLKCLLPVPPWGADVLLQKNPFKEAVVCTVLLSTPCICFQLLGHPYIMHVLLLSAD